MKYLVMECGLSYAVVMDGEGRFFKVPNLGYTVGQTLQRVVLLPERPAVRKPLPKYFARWCAMAACLCLMLLGSWAWWTPIGTVRMQINPDVQMSVNRFDRVVALQALNKDGAMLLEGSSVYGKEIKTVSENLADRAVALGYLENGGKITLTVDSEKEKWKTAAEETLVLELEIHFDHQIMVTVAEKQPAAKDKAYEQPIDPALPWEEKEAEDDENECIEDRDENDEQEADDREDSDADDDEQEADDGEDDDVDDDEQEADDGEDDETDID